MIGVDTNIILRMMLEDNLSQLNRIKSFMKKHADEKYYISISVLFELIWTLKSTYKYKRKKLPKCWSFFLNSGEFEFEDKKVVATALSLYLNTEAGLADIIIGLKNAANGCSTTITLDEDAGKLKGYELI